MSQIILTAQVEGIGQCEITFDAADLFSQFKPEHFAMPCHHEHSDQEIAAMVASRAPRCPECHGFGFVLTPAGDAIKPVVKETILRWMKTRLEKQLENLAAAEEEQRRLEAEEDVRRLRDLFGDWD